MAWQALPEPLLPCGIMSRGQPGLKGLTLSPASLARNGAATTAVTAKARDTRTLVAGLHLVLTHINSGKAKVMQDTRDKRLCHTLLPTKLMPNTAS